MEGEAMKLQYFSKSILIIALIFLFYADEYYPGPVSANNGESAEYEYQTSDALETHYTLVVPDWSHRTNSEHKDFLKFALSLNEVKHGESKGNSVQRMREDKLEMPEYWYFQDGWQELSLDQKRTLVTGCVYFLNLYLRESICLNEKMKTTYDQFSARITVEEIVNHVENLYKMPQYQDEDAEWLIAEYMQYNFWDYMGLTIAYPG
jgi:hypothetical protein